MVLSVIQAVGSSAPASATAWIVVGFVGQAVFGARFVVQLIASEIRKESYVPLAFWFLSVAGGLVLLSYAVHRRDPVFIAGQAVGLLIYARNLVLIFRKRARKDEHGSAAHGK